jgi:hypothetical protein
MNSATGNAMSGVWAVLVGLIIALIVFGAQREHEMLRFARPDRKA